MFCHAANPFKANIPVKVDFYYHVKYANLY